jgi:hypothetical protein
MTKDLHTNLKPPFPWGLSLNILMILGALGAVIWMARSQPWLKYQSSNETLSSNETPSSAIVAAFKQEAQQEALRLKLLKVTPTFGFDNLIADWTFLKFLQYFGDDKARAVTGYALSEDYFEIITRHDPQWVDSYLFSSTAISYYLAKPEKTVKLIDRGLEKLSPKINPKAWQVQRFKGLDQLLLLGDVPGAIASHEKAAEWTLGTPDARLEPIFREIAAFLRRDPKSDLIRFMSWSQVFNESKDKVVRQRAKDELLKLGAKMEVDKNGQVRFTLRTNK